MLRDTFLVLLVFAFGVGLHNWYRGDKLIARVPSDFNDVVRVHESREGLRRMRFGDPATQSAYDTKDPQRVVLPYLRLQLTAFDYLKTPPSRILVVGMGGGSMGIACRRLFPDAFIDLVDIDPAVVDVAQRFMGFRPDPRMRVHVVDGRDFVAAVEDPYDVILIDAFNGIDPPAALITENFFRTVKAALRRGGVVASNVVSPDRSAAFWPIVERQTAVFGPGLVLDVPGGPYNRVSIFFG